MADLWITDLRHLLSPAGSIEPRSGSSLKLTEHFTSIVAEITADFGDETCFPKVRCRRRPNRKPCPGTIESCLDPDTDEIVWWCPKCHDGGYINNWEGTLWDFSEEGSPRH
jgi:hypothetical protein